MTGSTLHRRRGARASCVLTLALLAGCAGSQPPAPVVFRGTDPVTPGPSAAGQIIRYDSHEAAVAFEGETIADVANRVGVSPAALAAYQGLTPDTRLRAGDEMVLPPREGGYGGVRVAEAPATAAVDAAPTTAPSPLESTPLGEATASAGETALPDDVPEDGTEIAAAPADGWSAARIAETLDEPGAEAAAPAPAPRGGAPDAAPDAAVDTPAEARVAAVGPREGLALPPSANRPLPPEPTVPETPASPDLGRYQTPEAEAQPDLQAQATERAAEAADREAEEALASAAPAAQVAPSRIDLGTRFRRPLEGPIAVPYNVSGTGQRNEGIDIAAEPGTPVRAAAAGEVALVSRSLGGLGTIVLIRHSNDVLTVYGRVDDVRVQKGVRVEAGQTIGTVAPGDGSGEPRLHFEVRRGAESVDPTRVL